MTLFIFSWPFSSGLLISPLENNYPAILDKQVQYDYIHVLGSGHKSDDRLPLHSQLTSSAVHRILEGLRLLKQMPNAKLVLSGHGGSDKLPHAVIMANYAVESGVDPARIIIFPGARDTFSEAAAVKDLLKGKTFALVTEASHMPRSIMTFEAEGLTPIAAPCHYRCRSQASFFSPPSAGALRASERAIHEYMGISWTWLKLKF